jgi:hypothetical protein
VSLTSPWKPWAVAGNINRPSEPFYVAGTRAFRRHPPCRPDQTAMDQPVITCPRCGGELRLLRRFTRMGRTFFVSVCQRCRYAQYEPSSQLSV